MTRTYRSRQFAMSLLLGTVLVAGCQSKDNNAITDENLVTKGNPNTNRIIGDANHQFQVLGRQALRDGLREGHIALAGSLKANSLLAAHESNAFADTSAAVNNGAADAAELTFGFPIALLGESQVFGAVVTKVSDKKKDTLGQLKLSDLTPIHSRAVVGKDKDGKYLFGIVGCYQACTEGSEEPVLFALPAVGVDQEHATVLVDLAELGKELNLIEMQDPQGAFTGLKTKSNQTIAFDYSLSTLVFDIETKMVPVDEDADAEETVFVTRWYLRLSSVFDPAFTPRTATPGVGFFMTERVKAPKVQRWDRASAEGSVKYFIKNVPEEHRAAIADSFDEWNKNFVSIIGKKLLSYEFLEKEDPRYKLVVAGDIRFNVMEWDLDNVAPYGGFGPSIANQHTGEMLSANVLIQGPKIIDGYSKWFEVGEHADALRNAGDEEGADKLLRDFTVAQRQAQAKASSRKFALNLNSKLSFSIKSQDPSYEDPAFQRDDFELIPKGVTFKSYMLGYFHDMVEHELGHNLGLRHNFRGNLGAKDPIVQNGVSHSVMEYLGRGHRHLDQIGEYDAMALRWGYAGILPERLDMFCTDEDVAAPNKAANSAECSRDDAEKDPFKFFETKLARGIKLLTAPDSKGAPTWSTDDMDRELTLSITGMGLYAYSASATGAKWTNFFTGGGRPAAPAGVKAYVLKQVKAQVCAPSLETAVAQKETEEAKKKTEQNVQTLRNRVKSLLSPLKLYTEAELACG